MVACSFHELGEDGLAVLVVVNVLVDLTRGLANDHRSPGLAHRFEIGVRSEQIALQGAVKRSADEPGVAALPFALVP